jgi:hypothetical protein
MTRLASRQTISQAPRDDRRPDIDNVALDRMELREESEHIVRLHLAFSLSVRGGAGSSAVITARSQRPALAPELMEVAVVPTTPPP